MPCRPCPTWSLRQSSAAAPVLSGASTLLCMQANLGVESAGTFRRYCIFAVLSVELLDLSCIPSDFACNLHNTDQNMRITGSTLAAHAVTACITCA